MLLWSVLLVLLAAPALSADSAPRLPGVHALYHLHFDNSLSSGAWAGWNHRVEPPPPGHPRAPHIPRGRSWLPPHDLCSRRYPELGPYSSFDARALETHVDALARAGVTLLVVPWWISSRDVVRLHPHSGLYQDGLRAIDDHVLALLRAVSKHPALKVTFRLGNNPGRNVDLVHDRVSYLLSQYYNHPSFFKTDDERRRPLFFVSDFQEIRPRHWRRMLVPGGDLGDVKGFPSSSSSPFPSLAEDCLFVADWSRLEGNDDKLLEAGFDGVSSVGLAEHMSSREANADVPAALAAYRHQQKTEWDDLVRWAESHGLFSVLSVSPGWDAARIRPWTSDDVVAREGGDVFRRALQQASWAGPSAISIDSWNDWCHGTQIEPARAYTPGEEDAGEGSCGAAGDDGDADTCAGSGAGDGGGKAGAGSTRMCKQMLTLLGVDVDYAYPGYAGDDPNLYVDIARSAVGGDDAA